MARNNSAQQVIEYPSRRKQRAAKRNLRVVRAPKMRPSAEVAAERIRMLIEEHGEAENYQLGWKRRAYAALGITEWMGWAIRTGVLRRVGTTVMDQVCNKARMNIADLMDEDY